MAFTFKPAVYKNTVLYELPRPVPVVRVQEGWDFEQFKVPLLDGDFVVGHSRQGVDIALEGQVGTQAGGLKISEEEMLDEIEALRSALNVASPGEKYEFFLYHDDVTPAYRKFKSCSTARFEYDLSDKSLFTYAVIVHAEDPVVYATGPGL